MRKKSYIIILVLILIIVIAYKYDFLNVKSLYVGYTEFNVGIYGLDNTGEWINNLGVNYLKFDCKLTPQECIQKVNTEASSNNVQSISLVLNDNYNTAEKKNKLLDYALNYSQLSLSNIYLKEVGFGKIKEAINDMEYGTGMEPTSLINNFITNLKYYNSNLKFSIIVEEEDWRIPSVSLPEEIREKVDTLYFYIAYRQNGLILESYKSSINRLKELYPNAKIILGSYAYDRIDYIGCWFYSAKCTQTQEIDYFKILTRFQRELLIKEEIDGIEFYPGNFGNEASWNEWNNQEVCLSSRKSECITNTQSMRNLMLSTFKEEPVLPLKCGQLINTNNYKVDLDYDLNCGNNENIIINASNVVINCNGHKMAPIAISPDGNNITIENCVIETRLINQSLIGYNPQSLKGGGMFYGGILVDRRWNSKNFPNIFKNNIIIGSNGKNTDTGIFEICCNVGDIIENNEFKYLWIAVMNDENGNIKFRNNIVHDSIRGFSTGGRGAGRFEVTGNIFYNIKQTALSITGKNNKILNNQISNSRIGLFVFDELLYLSLSGGGASWSSNNFYNSEVKNNIFQNNQENFVYWSASKTNDDSYYYNSWASKDIKGYCNISFSKFEGCYQNIIDTTNTINGKPIYFLNGVENQIIENVEMGYFSCANCKNILLKNVKIEQPNAYGVFLYRSENITILDSSIKNNNYGLFITESKDIFVDSVLSKNRIDYSIIGSENVIINNLIPTLNVWVYSDLHLKYNDTGTYTYYDNVLKGMKGKYNYAFILGDTIDWGGYNEGDWMKAKELMSNNNINSITSILAGNHDTGQSADLTTETTTFFQKYLSSNLTFEKNFGNLLFIGMSDEGEKGCTQQICKGAGSAWISDETINWFESEVKRNQGNIIISLTHQPFYTSPPSAEYRWVFLEQSPKILTILDQNILDLWINGHRHAYASSEYGETKKIEIDTINNWQDDEVKYASLLMTFQEGSNQVTLQKVSHINPSTPTLQYWKTISLSKDYSPEGAYIPPIPPVPTIIKSNWKIVLLVILIIVGVFLIIKRRNR